MCTASPISSLSIEPLLTLDIAFVMPDQPMTPIRPAAVNRSGGLAPAAPAAADNSRVQPIAGRFSTSLIVSWLILISTTASEAAERSLLMSDPPATRQNVILLPRVESSTADASPGFQEQRVASLRMLPPREADPASVAGLKSDADMHNDAGPDSDHNLPNYLEAHNELTGSQPGGTSAETYRDAFASGNFPSLLHLPGLAPQSGEDSYRPRESPLRFSRGQTTSEQIACQDAAQYCVTEQYHPEDFGETPVPLGARSVDDELRPYYGKRCVPTQRPWLELGRPFYGNGIFAPAIPVFSDVNPLTPQLTVYGDWRAGVGVHDIAGQNVRGVANQLNLEADLRLTGTERLHAFTRPTDHNGRFTRFDFSDSNDMRFDTALDAQLEAGFFEGDLGAMWGGVTGQDAPFDLPIAAGLMPMVYQNGIWMEDAAAGVAVALPWQHSRALNWANYDATFFAILDQLTTTPLAADNSAAQAFGTAWFIEAYDGYIEADYAYVYHADNGSLSYHNSSLAYTRRYFEWMSNSVRVINNSGQAGPAIDRSADGTLLLLENLFRTDQAATVVPYANLFYGLRRPQSVGRALGAGGILKNTGINFDTDNLTGYPTLDPTGANAYGGAVGLNMLTADFRRQVVLEIAALEAYGDRRLRNATGEQYALGGRYQQTLTNWTLIRFDAMYGWLEGSDDLVGTRAEWRWKF